MGELCAVVELMKGFGQLSVTAAAAADLHAPAICVPEKWNWGHQGICAFMYFLRKVNGFRWAESSASLLVDKK